MKKYAVLFFFFVSLFTFSAKGQTEDFITTPPLPDFSEKEKLIQTYFISSVENKNRYEQLSLRWVDNDSTLTYDDVLFLRCYFTTTPQFDPIRSDSLGLRIYTLNEGKEFRKAIDLCHELRSYDPYNLVSYKEESYALKQLNLDNTCIWVKANLIAMSMLNYGDETLQYNLGSFEFPYYINNFVEGQIAFEMCFGNYPNKKIIGKIDENKLLALFTFYKVLIKCAYMTHLEKYYPEFIDVSKPE